MHRRFTTITLFALLLTLSISILALSGVQANGTETQTTEDGTAQELRDHRLLLATLWMQTAAEYRALCIQCFNTAQDRLSEALSDPTWTAAQEQVEDPSALPPAVVLDIDETVLDNSFYEARLIENNETYNSESWKAWSDEAQASPIPGALEFCRYAQSQGVQVIYITNRKENEREATAKNLRDYGFPMAEDTSNLILRGMDASSSKVERRESVVDDYRILLLIGDSLGDHAGLFNKGEIAVRAKRVDALREEWGRRWIVLPNPTYGDWEGALFDYDWGASEEAKQMKRYARLHTDRPESLAPGVIEAISGKAAAPRVTVDEVEQRHELISGGPLVGAVSHTQASIWLQTKSLADVQVRYWPKGKANAARMSEVQRTEKAGDNIASFTLAPLESGTEYRYEVFINGENANLLYPARFTTPQHWIYRNDGWPQFSFTFGSCAYMNDPSVDRIGRDGKVQLYGGDYEIYLAMAAEDADFNLWLGDNLYYRDPDATSEGGMRLRNRYRRTQSELQPLLASRANFAIWDDHDFGPNNSGRGYPLKVQALEVFKDYWPNEGYGASTGEGVYHTFVWGDCQFFMLDDRYFRAHEGHEDGMLGAEQMQWLKDALKDSYANFKFIVNGGQMVNPVVLYESFGKYPQEKEELLGFIRQEKIPGVIFLSGDRHMTELLKVERDDAYPLYEYTSSPLGSGYYGGHADEQDNPARVEGTLVGDGRNYARVQVLGAGEERRIVLSAHDKDGNEIWSHEIKAVDVR